MRPNATVIGKRTLVWSFLLPALAACHSPESVTWRSADAAIAGELALPKGRGPFPAVLVIGGSGSVGVDHPLNREHAKRLTPSGVAVLTYDKRGVGRSTGSWRKASLADLADDARAGLQVLRADSRIDPKRIGVIGHSQGGWIAPQLVAEDSAIAFLIQLAATPLSPLEQTLWITEQDLRKQLVDSALHSAVAMQRQILEVYAGRRSEAEVQAELDRVRTEPWFNPEQFDIQPDTAWNRRWLEHLPFDYNGSAVLERVRQPTLIVNGAADGIVPATPSQAGFQQQMKNARLTTILLQGAGHSLGTGDRGVPGDEYWRRLIDWMHQIAVL